MTTFIGSEMNTFIGIDPGVTGGIAFLKINASLQVYNCPKTPRDMVDLILNNVVFCCFAVIEKVHSFPRDGKKAAFTFGHNYGLWVGMLSSLHIPYKEVSPQKWMKYYSTPRKLERKTRKIYLKKVAQSLFPKTKITLKTADAILLSNYAKETYK